MKHLLVAAALWAMDEPPTIKTVYINETVCSKCEQFWFGPLQVQFPNRFLHLSNKFLHPDKDIEHAIDHPFVRSFLHGYQTKAISSVLHQEDEKQFYVNTHSVWKTVMHDNYLNIEIKSSFINHDYITFDLNYNGTVSYTDVKPQWIFIKNDMGSDD